MKILTKTYTDTHILSEGYILFMPPQARQSRCLDSFVPLCYDTRNRIYGFLASCKSMVSYTVIEPP